MESTGRAFLTQVLPNEHLYVALFGSTWDGTYWLSSSRLHLDHNGSPKSRLVLARTGCTHLR